MARFKVVLISQKGVSIGPQIVGLFERCPGPIQVSCETPDSDIELKCEGAVPWGVIFDQVNQYREFHRIERDTFVCMLMSSPNEYNWYAAEDPRNVRNGFGHVGDFSWITSAPSYAIAAHYVVKGILNALLEEKGIDWRSAWHDTPRGCLFDFCKEKQQLRLKLRTADICGDCMQLFQSVEMPEALIKQTVDLMELIRRSALNTTQYLTPTPEFSNWPFPVAVTRHKVVQATNPLLRFLLLLDHFDSLVRYSYLVHQLVQDRNPALVERPSLGWWVSQLGTVLTEDRHMREVVEIAERENVVALRNERRGHGWMAADAGEYSEDASHLEQVVSEIEETLRPFLERYQLVLIREIDLYGGRYRLRGSVLQGSHLLHPPFETQVEPDPRLLGLNDLAAVYVTEKTVDWFKKASPFIKSGVCPACHHSRILIADGGTRYIDAFMGHRVEVP